MYGLPGFSPREQAPLALRGWWLCFAAPHDPPSFVRASLCQVPPPPPKSGYGGRGPGPGRSSLRNSTSDTSLRPRCIPESPRWLISQNRSAKALRVLKHIARKNGKPMPASLQVSGQLQGEVRAGGGGGGGGQEHTQHRGCPLPGVLPLSQESRFPGQIFYITRKHKTKRKQKTT